MMLKDGDNVKENLQQMLIDELGDTDYCDGVRQGIEMAIDVIDEHLTVDTERHGHWIKHRMDSLRKCSLCGQVISRHEDLFDYCPWCGAKMDEEEECLVDNDILMGYSFVRQKNENLR